MKLRFTIRDLFWLTLVIALAIAFWIDYIRTQHAVAEMQRYIDIAQNSAQTDSSTIRQYKRKIDQLEQRLAEREQQAFNMPVPSK
jgi:hypothetical protein